MKRQTRDELAAECERLRTENTVLSHAMSFLVRDARPNAVETVKEKDGGRYSYQAFEVCAPHGGILLVTFHYPGQRPLTNAYYLEGFARDQHWLPEQLEHRCAIERLQGKARALQSDDELRYSPNTCTPGGFLYTEAPPGLPAIGARVRVVARRSVIDWPYEGREGVVLGYSVPRGYAIVRCDKQPDPSSQHQEVLLHPESLETLP